MHTANMRTRRRLRQCSYNVCHYDGHDPFRPNRIANQTRQSATYDLRWPQRQQQHERCYRWFSGISASSSVDLMLSDDKCRGQGRDVDQKSGEI